LTWDLGLTVRSESNVKFSRPGLRSWGDAQGEEEHRDECWGMSEPSAIH
jgi:hypothetical protein